MSPFDVLTSPALSLTESVMPACTSADDGVLTDLRCAAEGAGTARPADQERSGTTSARPRRSHPG